MTAPGTAGPRSPLAAQLPAAQGPSTAISYAPPAPAPRGWRGAAGRAGRRAAGSRGAPGAGLGAGSGDGRSGLGGIPGAGGMSARVTRGGRSRNMWVSAVALETGAGVGRASQSGIRRPAAAFLARQQFIVMRAYITLHDLHVFISPPSPEADFNGEQQTKLNPFPLAEPLRGDTVGGISSFHWAMHIIQQRIPSF